MFAGYQAVGQLDPANKHAAKNEYIGGDLVDMSRQVVGVREGMERRILSGVLKEEGGRKPAGAARSFCEVDRNRLEPSWLDNFNRYSLRQTPDLGAARCEAA